MTNITNNYNTGLLPASTRPTAGTDNVIQARTAEQLRQDVQLEHKLVTWNPEKFALAEKHSANWDGAVHADSLAYTEPFDGNLQGLYRTHEITTESVARDGTLVKRPEFSPIIIRPIPDTLPTMPLSPLETQLSLSEVGTETGIGTQTDADKGSSLSRYGALVASSLATILGAVLVIVAKTHGHDEIEVDDAGDIQPAEPDYDALSEQAAQEAEQAFTEKWQDPEMWGPGKVDSDGSNLETGEKNPYYGVAQDQETGEYFIGDNLSLEGERTLEAIKSQASETAVSQAKADYEQMLVEATGHNGSHASGTLRDEKNGRDHDAMIGVGATLIGLGGLATTLIAGNKLTHRSHDKQQAQGLAPEHGPVKNFIEQKLFMVKA